MRGDANNSCSITLISVLFVFGPALTKFCEFSVEKFSHRELGVGVPITSKGAGGSVGGQD